MITNTREDIYKKVFEILSSTSEFKTKSRRLKTHDELSPQEFPAFFMQQAGETVEQEKQTVGKWRLQVNLFLYVHTGGSKKVIPTQLLNPLLDAIEKKVRPELSKTTQTLGINGVSHVWISGGIEIFEGVLDDVAIAIIPLEIFAI